MAPEMTAMLTGIATLLIREAQRTVKYRNGNRAPSEDRVRLIIREETKDLRDNQAELRDSLGDIKATLKASALLSDMRTKKASASS